MKKTSKMTQPLPTAPVLPAPEAPNEPQALPAPVLPQTVALPPSKGPQMQHIAAD